MFSKQITKGIKSGQFDLTAMFTYHKTHTQTLS